MKPIAELPFLDQNIPPPPPEQSWNEGSTNLNFLKGSELFQENVHLFVIYEHFPETFTFLNYGDTFEKGGRSYGRSLFLLK